MYSQYVWSGVVDVTLKNKNEWKIEATFCLSDYLV